MGRASHHRLGNGNDTKNRSDLERIHVLLAQKPSTPGADALLACGARHTIYAPVPGELWGWGCNRAGQTHPNLGLHIGLDLVKALPTPTRLPSFGAPFVDVACGYDFSAAISGDATQQQLWLWGRLDELLPASALRPHPSISGVFSVADLAGTDMVSVKAGFAHVLVMTRSGQVIALGANRHGQNGRWDSTLPQAVPLPEAAKCIAAGSTHSCVVTQSGAVYAFGSAGDAKLGNGATADSHVPLLVPDIADAAVARCGVDHTIVVCSSGRAFAFGFAQHGAMGVGSLKQHPTPRPVLVDARLRDAVCGADFLLLLQ